MVKSVEKALVSSLDELIAEERSSGGGGGGSSAAPSGSWRGRGGGRVSLGIRKNTSNRRGRGGVWRGRGRGRGRGGFRGGRGRGGRIRGLASNKPSSAFRSAVRESTNAEGTWGHDKFEAQYGGPRRRRSAPVKRAPVSISTQGCIHVSGLDSGVTSDDVKDIFQQRIGIVTSAYVVYDKNGNSTGTAKVTFARSADAREAISRLDKALVDKKQMRIKMDASTRDSSSSRLSLSRSPRRAPTSPLNRNRKGRGFQNGSGSKPRANGFKGRSGGQMPNFEDVANPLDRGNDLTLDSFGNQGSPRGGGGFRGRGGRRGGFRGRGRGRGRGRNNGFGNRNNFNSGNVTSDMLDKELDSYMEQD